MAESQTALDHKVHVKIAAVLMALLYIFVSVSTFYATRLVLPIIGNLGRGALTGLPTVFTFYMPLVIFFFLILFIHCSNLIHKRKILLILSLILLFFSVFNLTDLAFVIPFLLDGNAIVGVMSPLYPLDILIYNILLFLLSIIILIFRRIDKKDHIVTTTCKVQIPHKKWVFVGFMLPFATYFFGEIMVSIEFWFEPIVLESVPFKILTYLCFLLPTLGLLLYCAGQHKRINDNRKLKIIFNLIAFIVSLSMLIIFVVTMAMNPLIIAEYLQWEFAFGIILKIPFGAYVAILLPLVISLINLIKIMLNKKEVSHE